MVVYLVTQVRAARVVFTDPRFSSDLLRYGEAANLTQVECCCGAQGGGTTLSGPAMITSDPPVHTRLRGLVSRAFTAKRVANMRPRVQAMTDELIDDLSGREWADLMAEFADPLPARVIFSMFGIEADAQEEVRSWMGAMVKTPTRPEELAIKDHGSRMVLGYLMQFVNRRRPTVDLDIPEDEQPDLLSALICARDGAGRLNEAELAGMWMQLFLAGYTTTAGLIGNGVLALLRNPDQLGSCRS